MGTNIKNIFTTHSSSSFFFFFQVPLQPEVFFFPLEVKCNEKLYPWFSIHLMKLSGTKDIITFSGKIPACQCRRHKRHGFDPWVGKIPWKRAWQPTPVSLPGESHGQRILAGYSSWGRKNQIWLKRLNTHLVFFENTF